MPDEVKQDRWNRFMEKSQAISAARLAAKVGTRQQVIVDSTGALVMRADKVGSDTMLSRIVAMVAEAQRSRAPIQRMADTVAGWFVPAVIAVAVLALG